MRPKQSARRPSEGAWVGPSFLIREDYESSPSLISIFHREQFNLTPYPILIPEKRRFFLEDSDVFDFLLWNQDLLFFTRQIGIDPVSGQEVPIDVGGKIAGHGSGFDLGVMDVTVALSWWPLSEFGSGAEWPIIEAFGSGFARQKHLTEAEVAAIPTVYNLRAYTSLIHRLGRYRQGVSGLEAVVERAHAALERHRWLAENSRRLVDTLARCLVI